MRDTNDHRPMSRRDVMWGAAAVSGAVAAAALAGPLVASSDAVANPDPGPGAPEAPGAANAAPAAAAPPRVTGIGDWLGSLVQVATVAANVLPLMIAAREGDASVDPYDAGAVQFEVITVGNSTDLYAHNTSDTDAGLLYTTTRSAPDSNLSVYQPLPSNNAYKCEPDLLEFADGDLSLAPTPVSTQLGPLTRALSFAVRGLTIAAGVSVVGGVSVSIQKGSSPGTFNAVVTTTGPAKPLNIRVEATGVDGNVVRAEWSGGGTGPTSSPTPTASHSAVPASAGPTDTITIPLSPGVNLDPVIQLLNLNLDIDAAGLDAVTADRRARTIRI
ncbi:hypothetical protein OG792_03870 [Micromonospora sp. NBC_01699]|uniref:hypothetical protein n=1 Tax=Micromonospora sp. NBC_01699 TaxID=2975984 RepID=UPI002E294D93|nr:hypothetical protein [Micromonospora sp. NBC_01699]